MNALSATRSPLPPSTALPLPSAIRRALRRVTLRHAAVCVAECLAVLLTVLPTSWLVQATVDRWLSLPWPVRLILLLANTAAAVWVVFRFAIQPLRHCRSRESAALRIERAVPELRSALISAVELSSGRPGAAQGSLTLVTELLARVEKSAPLAEAPSRAVPAAGLKTWLRRAGLATGLAIAATLVFWPQSLTLIARIFLDSTPAPTRTTVIGVTGHETTVTGASLRLAARAEGVVPRSGIVHLEYANGDRAAIPVHPSPVDPGLFEITLQNVQQSFSYRFALNDGSGDTFRVTTRTAPVIESLRLVQKFPAYTGLPEEEVAPGNLTLRAGSEVTVEARASEPLEKASIRLEGAEATLAAEIDGSDPASVRGRFAVPAKNLTGVAFPLVNREGVASRNETVYRVILVPDLPPVLELLTPTAGRLSVLMTSKPRLVFTVRDDFAVKDAVLKYEVTRPTFTSADPVVQTGEIPIPLPSAGAGPHVFTWDLAAQKPALTEGCTLTYWIEARDNNDVTGPGVGQTPRRTLAIVTEAEKRAEVIELLGARASQIEQISDIQKKVNQDLDGAIRKTQPRNTP